MIAQKSFYEAVAQVIPVLLLVFALELALYRQPGEPLWIAYSFMGAIVGMVAGEVSALCVLATGDDGAWALSFSSAAIGVGASAVFMRASLLIRNNLLIERSKEVALRFEIVTTLAAGILMVAVTATLVIAGIS